MQDWDRIVMILVGLGVSCWTALGGWRFWKRREYVAVAGVVLLILSAIGLPILLTMFAT